MKKLRKLGRRVFSKDWCDGLVMVELLRPFCFRRAVGENVVLVLLVGKDAALSAFLRKCIASSKLCVASQLYSVCMFERHIVLPLDVAFPCLLAENFIGTRCRIPSHDFILICRSHQTTALKEEFREKARACHRNDTHAFWYFLHLTRLGVMHPLRTAGWWEGTLSTRRHIEVVEGMNKQLSHHSSPQEST